MPSGKTIYQTTLVTILGIAVVGSTLALATRSDDYTFFDPLIEVKALVSRRFVEDVNEDRMQEAAIEGMLESLGDPYTTYVPPAALDEFDKQLKGEYVGIGALVQTRDDWLTIVTPLEDSPAFRAGLIADDRIVKIAGESTFGKTVTECVETLKGQAGSTVTLTIERTEAGDVRRFEVDVVREKIVTLTVKGVVRTGAEGDEWDHLIDHNRNIGYIRLTQFTPTSSEEVGQLLSDLGAPDGSLGGLILDLRGNPGGVLSGAVQLADMFLEEGVIVSTRGRAFEDEVQTAKAEGTLPDFPMIVMIDGQSASASEVLSGALLENDRAIVLGTRSYGKGSVQSVIPLRTTPGAQLKMTEQGYFLPSGRSIQRKDGSAEWGVDPSPGFFVDLTTEEMRGLWEARRDGEVIRSEGADGVESKGTPSWVRQTLRDPQLAAALDAMQMRIDQGEWKPVGGDAPTGEQVLSDEVGSLEIAREQLLRELTRVDRRLTTLLSTEDVEAPPEESFWDDDIELDGGALEVFDASGKKVAHLRITGDDLEQWLLAADVEAEDAAAEDATPE